MAKAKTARVRRIPPGAIAVSPADAADMLGVSKRTISNLINNQKLKARKLGKRTLVDMDSLRGLYALLPEKTDLEPLFPNKGAVA